MNYTHLDTCDAYVQVHTALHKCLQTDIHTCPMNILQPRIEEREEGGVVAKEQVKQKERKKERVLILTQYELWDLQTNSRSGTMGTRPTE